MDKELQFAKALQKVKELAKLSGNVISKAEIDEQFASLDMDEEQMKLVYEYLEKANIGIDKEIDTDALLTGEDTNYLQFYLEELKELPAVSEGEKEAVTLSAMAGDETAQTKLIEIMLPEVIDFAKLYAGQGVLLEDLIGEGNVALTMGVTMLGCFENAMEAQGALGKMIMDAMEELIASYVTEDEVDQKIAERVNGIMEKAKELAEALGRKVTKEELAEETGLAIDDIQEAIRFSAGQIEYLETEK
ncbi:MAG: hypothetical protein IKJ15_07955 [Lachnospiraceae bacterium]|nr:hypothetical protein [Lachnospiraceae bacterium]